MKRFVITKMLCFILISTVYADAIAEPYNNSFYREHSGECVYLGRRFYADDENGYVPLLKEPGAKRELERIENGKMIHVMFTYDYNGEIWGVIEIRTQGSFNPDWLDGWILMSQLLLVYDYISFEEEHQDEFYPYYGDYEEIKTAGQIVLWTYPGSGEYVNITPPEKDNNTGELFKINHVYKDGQGREWGFSGYWYGGRNIWICLSDPADENIPADNAKNPPADIWQPELIADISGDGFSSMIIIIVLIIVLILSTIILIRIFWKPKNQNN